MKTKTEKLAIHARLDKINAAVKRANDLFKTGAMNIEKHSIVYKSLSAKYSNLLGQVFY